MRDFFGNEKYRKIIIAFWITLMVAIVTFVVIFLNFTKKLKNTSDIGLLSTNTVNDVLPNNDVSTKSASTTDDKNINAVANQILNDISSDNKTSKQAATSNVSGKEEVSKNENKAEVKKEVVKEETPEVKALEFSAPVAGEIITDYAEESLVYSETLKEWTTHLGVDIKADKASSVLASEAGTVKSIKNDPRYGLTITISHADGYETIYSNLLSSEFVNEGDTVTKGQAIGTIGESASFEVAQVPHLHFEITKDGKNINPTTCLK